MREFLMGAIAMGSLIASVFFLRFWRTSGDRLFGMFALAFLLLAATRLGLILGNDAQEATTPWYWVRLAAFILILLAILDKNRRRVPA